MIAGALWALEVDSSRNPLAGTVTLAPDLRLTSDHRLVH